MILRSQAAAGPSRVANSSIPDNVITYCGSGSSCQSYEECGGVSLEMEGDHIGSIHLVYRAFKHVRPTVGSSV